MSLTWMIKEDAAFAAVRVELASARDGHPAYNSSHEGYAVILEELDELWDEVKKKRGICSELRMREEATQIAATAIRFILDVCDKGEYISRQLSGHQTVAQLRQSYTAAIARAEKAEIERDVAIARAEKAEHNIKSAVFNLTGES